MHCLVEEDPMTAVEASTSTPTIDFEGPYQLSINGRLTGAARRAYAEAP